MAYEDIINVETAEERFAGNYALFSKFLYSFPDRSLFSDLEKQIKEGNIKEAFETAHAMKGVVGNLSLKKVETSLFPVVEALRAGSLPDEKLWKELVEAYRVTIDTIEEVKKEGTLLFKGGARQNG